MVQDQTEELEKNNENSQNGNKNNTEKNQSQDMMNRQKEIIEEQEDRLKRIMAEFENFKKRSAKERDNLYNSLLSDIITSFLPVIDNLEKAVSVTTEDETYKQGMELVLKQFIDVLKTLGVEEIPTVGKPFDPELHEAVSSVNDETLGEKIVKEEYRKGYRIGSKVIRHSIVVVAN